MAWIKLTERISSINVERQSFNAEVTDAEGRQYTRVPDHFIPLITSMGLGSPHDPPEGTELEDLPKADPLRDGAISDQARLIEVQKADIESLRNELSAMSANFSATALERDQLKFQVHELTVKVSELEEALEEAKDAVPETVKRK